MLHFLNTCYGIDNKNDDIWEDIIEAIESDKNKGVVSPGGPEILETCDLAQLGVFEGRLPGTELMDNGGLPDLEDLIDLWGNEQNNVMMGKEVHGGSQGGSDNENVGLGVPNASVDLELQVASLLDQLRQVHARIGVMEDGQLPPVVSPLESTVEPVLNQPKGKRKGKASAKGEYFNKHKSRSCDICHEKFHNRMQVHRHINKVHSRKFDCAECGYVAYDYYKLTAHLGTYKCFKRRWLKKHKDTL